MKDDSLNSVLLYFSRVCNQVFVTLWPHLTSLITKLGQHLQYNYYMQDFEARNNSNLDSRIKTKFNICEN